MTTNHSPCGSFVPRRKKEDEMPQLKKSRKSKQARAMKLPSNTAGHAKQVPSLPIRRRLGQSKISIWLLAICIAVALLLRAVTPTESQQQLQEWLPNVLEIPEDVEVLADRKIGSNLRMLTLSTSVDVDDLFEWEDALRANGYAIGRLRDEPPYRVIEFNGTGIVNAKIIAGLGGNDERTVIQIDATVR